MLEPPAPGEPLAWTRVRDELSGLRCRLTEGAPITAELPLLAGWAAIGIGMVLNLSRYSPLGAFLLTCGTALVVVVVAAKLQPGSGWCRAAGVAVALATAVFGATFFPAGLYGAGPWLAVSRGFTSLAAVGVALWMTLDLPRARIAGYVVVGAVAFSGVAMILASPAPAIDVWYMLQAAASGLSHGANMYSLHWSSHLASEVQNQFEYLPGSAVLLWPFHVVFGDVRYGLLAAMAASALILIRVSPGPIGGLVAALALLYPRATFGLEQAWTDPLVLVTMTATAFLVTRGRRGWAVVAFAACLTCKQSAWLFIPVAAMWPAFGWRRTLLSVGAASAFISPWLIADIHAFYQGAIASNLYLPPRATSLSLYTTVLNHGWNPTIAFTSVATLAAIVLVVLRAPRNAYGFLLGSATVLAVFDLTNKQTHFNWWALVACLLVAALAFGHRSANVPGGHDPLDLVALDRPDAR
ncbi:MAG TPA: hypothetical protein VEI83_16085 [Acidimicrobiales bacterium]|nr:hypothetical protein [Acidimicrobiales bacterium]